MKTFILCLLLLIPDWCYADQMAKRVSVKQVLIPTGEYCQSYYSLYEQGIFCKNDIKYRRMFRTVYEVNNRVFTVDLNFYPKPKFRVSDDGVVYQPEIYYQVE